jgi:hypothetical protein
MLRNNRLTGQWITGEERKKQNGGHTVEPVVRVQWWTKESKGKNDKWLYHFSVTFGYSLNDAYGT